MKNRFYEVYMNGGSSSTQYYQNFENAYRAWITMATPTSNEVVAEILMSGMARAKEKMEEDGMIFLDFGDCILGSMDFSDEEEEEE